MSDDPKTPAAGPESGAHAPATHAEQAVKSSEAADHEKRNAAEQASREEDA